MQVDHPDAYQVGISWASELANVQQLSRLRVFRQRLDRSRVTNWRDFFEGRGGCCAYSPSELVAFEILGTEQGLSRQDAKTFWCEILGEHEARSKEPTYIRRFAEGALAQSLS